MKKQQKYLIELTGDHLRSLCDRLPLEESDRNIAFALATLCAATGSYTPARGVGQREIAKLAGLGVRTVKRRLPYLVRYGILDVDRSNGRSNCYQFDLGMLIDAPPITHDLYGFIKEREPQAKPAAKQNERQRDRPGQRLLFDDMGQDAPETTAPEPQDAGIITRMTGAVSRFTKRMFTIGGGGRESSTGDTVPETGAKPVPSVTEPGPNRCQSITNRGQTGAIDRNANAEPVPTAEFGAEKSPEPVPNRCHRPQNRCQTGAKPVPSPPTVQDTVTDSETLIKNYSLQSVHVDLDSASDARGTPQDAWRFPPRTTKPRNSELPLGKRKVYWTRDVEDPELEDPAALQELFEIAVDQGFFLDSDVFRREFFALARYVSRQKNIRKKIGLFSSLVDRTYDNKLPFSWEKNITANDELWAAQAIKKLDSPTYERTQS